MSTPAPNAPPWDLVVRPKTAWFDLRLKDLWRYRELTWLFVWRDFVAQYKQTVLGPLWYLIQPILTTITFTLIFGRAAGLSTDGAPRLIFYMAGITCWSYFAECLTRTSQTFITNASLFGKVYFPRLCVPISMVLSSLIKFSIQFGLFLLFLCYYLANGAPVRPNGWVLLTPVLVGLQALLALGLGIVVSALTTRYRDLQHLVTFGVQLLMFGSSVVIPLSSLHGRLADLVRANPLTAIIETYKYAYLGVGAFDPGLLLYSAAVSMLTLFLGILLFSHVERTFMDTV